MCPFLPSGGYPDSTPPFFYYLTHPSTVRRSNRCGPPRELHVDLVGQLQDVAPSVIAFEKSVSCRMIGSPPEGWCMWLCLLLFFRPEGIRTVPSKLFFFLRTKPGHHPSLTRIGRGELEDVVHAMSSALVAAVVARRETNIRERERERGDD